LDIGTSYLHNVVADDVIRFAAKHGGHTVWPSVASGIAERSKKNPGTRILFVSELLDLVDIDYVSFDVCSGLKTELFDLNRESIYDKAKGAFDVVLNFGTSEHIINQLNGASLGVPRAAIGSVREADPLRR